MTDKIDIQLDAKEILDHVDDMLAWEAIASQAELDFEWSHLLCAQPLLRLGDGAIGQLVPAGLQAEDRGVITPAEAGARNRDDFEWFRNVLPTFLEQPEFTGMRYAKIVECEASKGTPAGTGVQAVTSAGDNVPDLVTADMGAFTNVRYHIESVGEVARQNAKLWIRIGGLPQVARVFRHQHIFAFVDGRARSNYHMFAYWNRRFFTLNKKPLAIRMEDGHEFHPSLLAMGEALGETIGRATRWEVELSLGHKRTGIALQTDAIGAREFVNMVRKGDSSSGRRKAIVHWVNAHMRRVRSTDEKASIEVRGHLRGMSALNAGRYWARIYPARELVLRNQSRMVNS
jgi:hypothetical protein